MHAMPQRRATLPTTPLKQHKQPTTHRLPAVARYGCACCLTVVNAAGRHLDLELPAGSSIRDVKVRLSSFWDLPIRAQKLLLGEEELENSATLDNLGAELDKILLTLLSVPLSRCFVCECNTR